MSRGKIIAIVLGIGFAVLLFAIFKSCRSGSVPPAERGMLEETSYRAVHMAAPHASSVADLNDSPRADEPASLRFARGPIRTS